MDDKDYKHLGFRCGIEIHQQLEGHKLFCRCHTIIRKDDPDFQITRRLKSSAGESGKTDIAAKHEEKKGKYFIYQGYYDTTCLVELDEEPPGDVNKDALNTTLQIAKLLNCTIVDKIQFMRKIVIDGSNTSGFQRTALIGRDGSVEINGRKIGIPTVCLEEEACQVAERKDEYDIYNLSRQGIPLIEIATDPDISSPEECKETALKLGMILRSVPGLKRGLGTIRQDVNVSVKDGARTEIKGFQEVRSIPAVIDNEIKRQLDMIKKGKRAEESVRKAEADGTTSYLRPMPGAERMYPETDVPAITPEIKDIGKVELLSEKSGRMMKLGLAKDLANAVAKEGKADIMLDFAGKFPDVKPAFIAETMISTPRTLKRKENIDVRPTDRDFETIFSRINEGKISRDAVYDILKDIGKTGKPDFSKYGNLTGSEIEKIIKKVIEENKGAPFNALIGKAMAQLKGKADAKKIIEMLQEMSKQK